MQEPLLNPIPWGPDLFFFEFCPRSLRDTVEFTDYFQVEPVNEKEYLGFVDDWHVRQNAGIGFWMYWREHAAPEKKRRRDALCGVTANRTRPVKYDFPSEVIMGIVDVEVDHLSDLGNITGSAQVGIKIPERWSQLLNLEHFFSEILGCKRTWNVDYMHESYGFLM